MLLVQHGDVIGRSKFKLSCRKIGMASRTGKIKVVRWNSMVPSVKYHYFQTNKNFYH